MQHNVQMSSQCYLLSGEGFHLYSLRVEHDEAAGEGHGGHHPQHEIDCVGRQSHLPLHLGAVPAHTRTGIDGANSQEIVVNFKA